MGAADVLVHIGEPAVEPLIEALSSDDAGVRYVAAWTLGKIGDRRAVEPLIAAMKDRDKGVKKGAAVALGDIGDGRAVEPLIQALKDEDESIQRAVRESLERTISKKD